jgi:hypothetical protein
MQEERKAQEKRLKEIQATSLQGLSDEAILELLAERKHLENTLLRYIQADQEKAREKHNKLVEAEKKVEGEIQLLNEEISPSKNDEELLLLVQKRHKLETELLKIHKELGEPLPVTNDNRDVLEESKNTEKPESVVLPETAVVNISEKKEVKQEKEVVVAEQPQMSIQVASPKKALFKEDTFGEEEIKLDGLQESGDFEKYVYQLEASRESLGSFLQSLPKDARSNKSFMLKVASIDPAYAMHYAANGLRKNESFHVQIASLKNNRNSGNAVAEMDPAMHTGKVILAATRQDFHNVHYIHEDMPEYDEILLAAKKGALEKISQLKEAVSLSTFIPKILQQDTAFMAEVEKIVANK